MDNKATLTYSFSEKSDENLSLTLSTKLAELLSSYEVDWHHAYRRNSHSLQLKVKILPLTSTLLNRKDLITRPYCHIFWTDCSDIDLYRSSVKGEISSWLNLLSTKHNIEWIIVVIVGDVLSRLTKAKLQLPRMSIIDKVKADFCSKQPERLQVLYDPTKESTKSSEAWSLLVTKVASMTVRCMETVVANYEDQVRVERERRNEKSWDFCIYFLLQEELAFMYEMLGMCGCALVQYDELDAMFTQYVLNANAGDIAHWLAQFSRPILQWHSLLLWKSVDNEARNMIVDGKASLVDIRNYLFSRLCHLLFEMGKLVEVTQRMHYFLHSIVTEIDILEIKIPTGAVACWIFMCCLELVEAFKQRVALQNAELNEASSIVKSDMSSEMLVLENASLWNLARLKLYYLGKVCGLLPGIKPTSSQLQMVVELLSGMGDGTECGEFTNSPSQILREALSSTDNFQKHYFELSELAMGTFKHMGHYRAARSIGRDLANFYLMLGEPSMAEGYLVDAVRIFASDGWGVLQSKANVTLANCYKQMKNMRKYLRLCYALMCDNNLSDKERSFYCTEFQSMASSLEDRILAMNIWPLATVSSVRFIPAKNKFYKHAVQKLEVCIYSTATKPVKFHSMQISMEHSNCGECNHSRKQSLFDTDSSSTASSQFKVQIESDSETSSYLSTRNEMSSTNNNQSKSFKESNHSNMTRSRHSHTSSLSSRDFMSQQLTTMDYSGVIQLVSLNYKENLHRGRTGNMPSFLSLRDQMDIKDDDIAWSGITCKRTHELLRRQDSSHSHLGKHSIVTSVIMESYEYCLETSDVVIHPGKNIVQVDIKTDMEGVFQLQQLRLSICNVFFVLPLIYPIVSYTVTNQLPAFRIKQGKGLIRGVVQYIKLLIDTGDYTIPECGDGIAYHATIVVSDGLQLLGTTHCSVTCGPDYSEVRDVSPTVISNDESQMILKLPFAAAQSMIRFKLACLANVPATVVGLENKRRHRRTHSAPPATFCRSPKSIVRHRIIQEKSTSFGREESENDKTESTTRDVADTKNTSGVTFSNKLTVDANNSVDKNAHSSLKPKPSAFKMFRSKTPNHFTSNISKSIFPSWPLTKVDKNLTQQIPSLRINDDLIEVTLNEDDVSDDVTSVSSLPIVTKAKADISYLSRHDLKTSGSDSSDDGQEYSAITKLNAKSDSCIHAHSVSKVDKEKSMKQRKESSSELSSPELASSYQKITIKLPWTEVPECTSLLSSFQPLEFTHAWHYGKQQCRILTVTTVNVASMRLNLKNPRLRLCNVTNSELIYLGNYKSMVLDSATSYLFSWKVKIFDPSPSQVSVQFDVDLTSRITDAEDHQEKLSRVSYKFHVENVKVIYSVSCRIKDEQEIRCGSMVTLTISVTRLRDDSENETTSTGQQLIMFQILDTRGRWAVCGKNNGVLSFKTRGVTARSNDDNFTPIATATFEVMPLIPGFVHLPYVMLHRYLRRRSSEFDEQLSSTDSPVLKPPQLKAFERGEVFYEEQAQQIHVLVIDDMDNERKVTSL